MNHILEMKVHSGTHFENENMFLPFTFCKWKHILKIKANSKTNFENENIFLQCRSPTTALLEWNEPSFNGAMVTEYRLQLAIVSSRKCLSPPTITLSQSSSSTSSSIADLGKDQAWWLQCLFGLFQLLTALFIGGACLFTLHFLQSDWIWESCWPIRLKEM